LLAVTRTVGPLEHDFEASEILGEVDVQLGLTGAESREILPPRVWLKLVGGRQVFRLTNDDDANKLIRIEH